MDKDREMPKSESDFVTMQFFFNKSQLTTEPSSLRIEVVLTTGKVTRAIEKIIK